MKKVFLAIVLLGFCKQVFSQWTNQNAPLSATLNDVRFTSPTNGIAISSNSIVKTNDGGLNWNVVSLSTTYGFSEIHFRTSNVGYICGSNSANKSTVLKTNDGGQTWTSQQLASNYPLRRIHFSDDNNGYTSDVHGVIYTTIDGGVTWSSSGTGAWGLGSVNSLFFVSSSNGFVVGADVFGGIKKTTDKGLNWSIKVHPNNVDLNDVFFINSNEGWVVGDQGAIMHTNDMGETWTAQTSGTNEKLNSVHFITSLHGFVVGNNGSILVTKNGGVSWTIQNSTTSSNLNSVFFVNSQIGYACGATTTILKTINGGEVPLSNHGFYESSEKALVSPNPTNSCFRIISDESYEYSVIIRNITGSEFFSLTGTIDSINKELANHELDAGMYSIQIKNTKLNRVEIQKVIKY